MLSFSIWKKGKYVACEHLYFMFAKGMSCDLKVDIFIHQPTLTWNEVYHLLQWDKVWTFYWHLMGILKWQISVTRNHLHIYQMLLVLFCISPIFFIIGKGFHFKSVKRIHPSQLWTIVILKTRMPKWNKFIDNFKNHISYLVSIFF